MSGCGSLRKARVKWVLADLSLHQDMLQNVIITLKGQRSTDERYRAPGTLGSAQKHPAGWPPQLATRVQHSPPLCVLQQQSTSATFTVSMVGASPSVRGTQHTALSHRLAQLASALPIEKIAKVNVKAITKTLLIECLNLVALFHPCCEEPLCRAQKACAT